MGWAATDFNRLTYIGASLLLVGAWLLVLAFRGAYDTRFLGVGSEELKRVASGTVLAFASIASISFMLKASLSRGFVAVAVPVGLVLLLAGRQQTRRWLSKRRARGAFLYRTLVVGTSDERTGLVATFDREPQAGFSVVAVLDPPAPREAVDGWLDRLDVIVHSEHIDAVTVTRGDTLAPETLRRLAWRLEGPRIDLMVAPTLRSAFGPRLVPRPAPELPLVHLDEPRLSGPQRFAKGAADRIAAALMLVALAPLFVLITLAIALTSRGGVFFVQQRIGRRGRPFSFVKFRTMVDGAHLMRADVLGTPDPDMPERYRCDPRHHPAGSVPASLVARRAAAADQRADRLDVDRRAAADASRRGAPARRPRSAPPPDQAGPDRPVADLRPQADELGGAHAARPRLHRALVAGPRPGDPGANIPRGVQRTRRLLTRRAGGQDDAVRATMQDEPLSVSRILEHGATVHGAATVATWTGDDARTGDVRRGRRAEPPSWRTLCA